MSSEGMDNIDKAKNVNINGVYNALDIATKHKCQ
jgi:hypothetical protein